MQFRPRIEPTTSPTSSVLRQSRGLDYFTHLGSETRIRNLDDGTETWSAVQGIYTLIHMLQALQNNGNNL